MEEQFEYGELVEVRDFDKREWKERHYVGIMNGRHYVMLWNENPSNFSGAVMDCKQVRKMQKPEPDLIEIEQPEQGTIEYLQGQIHTLNKRLMVLENELRINELHKPVKKQLK